MCGQAPESISHTVSEQSELAGDECKIQRDKVGSTVRGMAAREGDVTSAGTTALGR